MTNLKRLSEQARRNSKTPQISTKALFPLDKLKNRAHQDTRDLVPEHVEHLAESIATIGLIQPIAIDRHGHILAGSHRRAAIIHVKKHASEAFKKHFPKSQIPVRIFDIDSTEDTKLALDIEVTENQARKNYSPEEIRQIANRYREAGYQDYPGRPPKGAKLLSKTISTVVGKSERTVKAAMAGETKETRKAATKLETLISRAATALQRVSEHPDFDKGDQKLLDRAIGNLEKVAR